MPTLKRWVQFLSYSGGITLLGYLFVQYGTPSDEQFIQQLSPELRARYYKEKALRARADAVLQRKVEETRDKPAWLQGSGAMRKLNREVAEEVLGSYEEERKDEALQLQKAELEKLANQEKNIR